VRGGPARSAEPPEPPAEAPATAEAPDFVERLFGMIFGKIEEKPFGLERMTLEKFPDQYPADVSGKLAQPVDSDDAEAAKWVRPCMAQTALETRDFALLYDADRDGWNAQAFHAAVDRRGPGVVLCVSQDGQVFGGYNSKGWAGIGENRPGLANFLFSWGDEGVVKLRKVGGAGMACVDLPELGISFGAEGLVVPLRLESPKKARVKLGPYYARMPGTESKSFLRNSAPAVQLETLRVYMGVWQPDEDVPFDDAMPCSLT